MNWGLSPITEAFLHLCHLKRHLLSSVHIIPQDDEWLHRLPLDVFLHGDLPVV